MTKNLVINGSLTENYCFANCNMSPWYDSPKEAIHCLIFFLAKASHLNIFSLTSKYM